MDAGSQYVPPGEGGAFANGFSPTPIGIQHNHTHVPEEWISKWLKAPTLCLAISLTMGIIGALIALTVLSKQNHGIASANVRLEVLTSIIPDLDVGIGLLWTTLPVLLFQIYSLAIGATITAASARQPYIELRGFRKDRQMGAPAEKSILLDYQSYWAMVAPFKALWYNHYVLAYSFTVQLLLIIVLSPVAAHLFFATTIPFSKHIEVQQLSKFSENGFNHDSLQPVLDIVSSTLIYGGRPIAWTTLTEALLPIQIPRPKDTNSGARNLTVSTSALKATLDCEVLSSSEFELQEVQSGYWDYSWADRGCSADNQEYIPKLVPGSSPYFVQTYAYQDCSEASGYTRILVIAAQDKNGSGVLTNKTAVSCIPSYSLVTGTLSLSVGGDLSTTDEMQIISFVPRKHSEWSASDDSMFNFNLQLIQGRYFDSANALTANDYGDLIYSYVRNSTLHDFFDGQLLKVATESTYASAFAIMASQFLVKPSTPKSIAGTLYVDETRIIVVLPVACAVLGILFAVAVMLGWIWIYTRSHDSILYENPTALLGAAVVLRNSRLMNLVEGIDGDAWCGKMSMAFLRKEEKKVPQEGWHFEAWEHPQAAFVNATTYVRPFGLRWVQYLRRLMSRR